MTSVEMIPTWVLGSVDLTSYPFAVDASSTADIGEPEMIVSALQSQLADGDIEQVVRHGNRVYILELYIEGPTLGDLAASEALLRAEMKKGGLELAHNPGDGFAPTSVFEVQTARLTPKRNDTHESHLMRQFTLTLTCAPFARSAELATVAGLEVGGSASTVTVDTCDSATDWTGTHNGVPTPVVTTWEAGAVSVRELVTPGPQTLTMTRTGAVDFSATRYLVAEIGYNRTLGTLPVTCTADGARSLPLLETRLISPGRFLYTFDTSGLPASSLTFSSYTVPDTADLSIFNVARTNQPPGQTPRQPSRIVEVRGTERTPGSLRISAPDGTTPLRLVLAASWPEDGSGFSPPLRRWRTAGNAESTLADTYSGKKEPLGPNYVYFDIPIESLPSGTYQLMMLAASNVAGIFAVESVIQSRHNGVTLGETTWGAGGTEKVTIPTGWILVPMGVYGIPIAAAKAGEFRILIKTPDTTDVFFDEAWLFPVGDNCALSAMLATEPHVWLDSADADSRRPRIWEGASADKSDAHFPTNGIHTMGQHVFIPERTAVFTAAGVDWPDVTLTYHKRWHSNAAED